MSDTKWKVLSSKELMKSPFFSLRIDKCELPDKRVMPKYYVMDFPEWVNIVPVTSDGQVILIRQYRHAAGEWFLEIPGGTTDPKPPGEVGKGDTANSLGGNANLNVSDVKTGVDWNQEDVLVGAKRELLEETGYESNEWKHLGVHYPNPAMQSNRMHSFLALNCKKVAEPNLDPFEEIEIQLVSVDECIRLLRKGKIEHSIVAASMLMALDYLEKA